MAGSSLPSRPGRRRLNAEINVVPYIDVMLVLLIIFMVTAPLLTQGVEVELPQAAAESVALDEEPLTLFVDRRGSYFLDVGTERSKALEDAELVRRVGIVLGTKPDTTVLIRADRRVDYGRVATGMTLLQQAGAKKLGFVTDVPGATAASDGSDDAATDAEAEAAEAPAAPSRSARRSGNRQR